MFSATSIVRSFVEGWGPLRDVTRTIRRNFSEDAVWENHGLVSTRGVDQACLLVSSLFSQLEIERVRMDILVIAEFGDTVLVERVVRMFDATNSEVSSVRGASIFEVRQGQIVAWRDYYNTIPFG